MKADEFYKTMAWSRAQGREEGLREAAYLCEGAGAFADEMPDAILALIDTPPAPEPDVDELDLTAAYLAGAYDERKRRGNAPSGPSWGGPLTDESADTLDARDATIAELVEAADELAEASSAMARMIENSLQGTGQANVAINPDHSLTLNDAFKRITAYRKAKKPKIMGAFGVDTKD